LTCEEEHFGRACVECACRLCSAVLEDEAFDIAVEYQALDELAYDQCVGDHTGPVLAAAIARGIPWRRLDSESLIQLGWGSRQQRIQKTITSATPKIAEWISLDKQLTKSLLDELGIPVAKGRLAASEDDAWAAACEIGVPVVVKPRDADYGKGVGLNLTTREEVLAAYRTAKTLRDDVIVERHAHGNHYRVTVVSGAVVAADERVVPSVVGDGRSTIAELIAKENLNPNRGDHRLSPLNRLVPDDDTIQTLAEQGFNLDTSIVPENVSVTLTRIAHLWAGAGCHDVTDQVHPLVAAQCISAVRAVGLDVAGVDVITPDIGCPLEELGGVILEINAEAGIFMHLAPYTDHPRPVCERIVESLFPVGDTGRIPLVCAVSRPDESVDCLPMAELLAVKFGRIGVAGSRGLYVGERRLKRTPQATLAGTRAVLLHPEVDAAVVERSVSGIRLDGLGFDYCDVAVILGFPALPSEEDLRALRVLVGAVSARGHIVTDIPESLLLALGLAGDSRVVRVKDGEVTGRPTVVAATVAQAMGVSPEGIHEHLSSFTG
jgi:cyanophycin synthetase